MNNNDSTLVKKDSVSTRDTTGLLKKDSLSNKNIMGLSKRDSIRTKAINPIHVSNLFNTSNFIENNFLKRIDYRTFGNIMNYSSNGFLFDLGQPIQPSDMIYYGSGGSSIQMLEDGIPVNNSAYQNLFLFSVQTESIDSVELITLPRSILVSSSRTPSAINIISKDFLVPLPFSRIKYYQGANSEAYFDGIFNTFIAHNLNAYFDVTNTKVDNSLTNNAGGFWQAKIKLKYLLNDNFNLITGYSHVNYNTQINKGIVYNNAAFGYDENSNVISSSDYTKDLQNRIYLKTLFTSKKFNFDYSLYYNYEDQVFKDDSIPEAISKYKTTGLSLRNYYNLNIFAFNLNADYENISSSFASSNYNFYNASIGNNFNYKNEFKDQSNYLISFNASAYLLDSSFIPSVFGKLSNVENPFYNYKNDAVGFDVVYKLDHFKFYLGLSDNTAKGIYENAKLFESSITYTSNLIFGKIEYFKRTKMNIGYFNPLFASGLTRDIYNEGITGNINLSYKTLRFNNTIKYMNIVLPVTSDKNVFSFISRASYRDSLFNGNLDLETGLEFNFLKNVLYNIGSFNFNLLNSRNDLVINFFLSGEIQKTAMLYFRLDNILDRKYFIVPYYPMPGRSFRFGVTWEIFN